MVNRCDERVIQFWISPLAKPEEGKNCVVHRSQMAPNVDNSVSSRRDFQFQLFACERAEEFAGSIHVGSPTAEGRIEENSFRSHCSSPFFLGGAPIGRRSGALARPAQNRRPRIARFPCRSCYRRTRGSQRLFLFRLAFHLGRQATSHESL